MGFWDRLSAMLPGERAGERSPIQERWWGQPGLMSAAGMAVTPQTVEQLDVVQGCQENLAGAISTLPIMVFSRIKGGAAQNDESEDDSEDGDDASDAGEPAPDHPLYRVLHDAPNDRQTSQEFFDEMVRHLSYWRNFYAKIVTGDDGSAIGSLEIIHPRFLQTIERKSDGHVWYTFVQAKGFGSYMLRDDQVWHIRKAPLTDDGLRGKPVFETSKELFGKMMATENFGAQFFRNGTNGGIITLPGFFKDKEEQENFIGAWREAGNGPNRHKDRILQRGATYTFDNVQNDKAQFLETLKQYEIKACRIWNMPPHRVGILDRSTFSNIEQQSVEFVMYTLAPFVAAIEQAIWRDLLLGDPNYFVQLNVAGLLRGDLKTRYAAFALGRQWGWLSVNDILKMENRKTIGKKGDVYLEPTNMKPSGQQSEDLEPAGTPGTEQQPPALPAPGKS